MLALRVDTATPNDVENVFVFTAFYQCKDVKFRCKTIYHLFTWQLFLQIPSGSNRTRGSRISYTLFGCIVSLVSRLAATLVWNFFGTITIAVGINGPTFRDEQHLMGTVACW